MVTTRAKGLRDGSQKVVDKSPTASDNTTPTHTQPKPNPKRYDCSNDDWKKHLNHEADQIERTQNIWNVRLKECGCCDIDLGGPETGTLVTPIHPLYRPERWIFEDFPNDSNLWRQIEPALKLASEIIESEPAMSFFRRIMYGTPVTKAGRTYLEYDQPKDTAEQDVAVREALINLAKHTRILFGAIHLKDSTDGQTHAIALVSQKWFGEQNFIRGNVDRLPVVDDYKTHYLAINQAYAE